MEENKKKRAWIIPLIIIIGVFALIRIYNNHLKNENNKKLNNKKEYYVDYENKIIHRNKECSFMVNTNLKEEQLSIYDITMAKMNDGFHECDSCFYLK